MTENREMLIKLVLEAVGCDRLRSGEIADHLIANGVVISKNETTTQRWIPVAERLPEPYVSVLTLRKNLDGCRCFQKVEHAIPVYDGTLAWYMDMSSWKSKVTHWMPLPEPPRKE